MKRVKSLLCLETRIIVNRQTVVKLVIIKSDVLPFKFKIKRHVVFL